MYLYVDLTDILILKIRRELHDNLYVLCCGFEFYEAPFFVKNFLESLTSSFVGISSNNILKSIQETYFKKIYILKTNFKNLHYN